jgi:hypothetical protein
MKYYKLLTQDLTSHKDTKWEIGVPITVTKAGNEMCSNQVLHCYNHPMLAVIFNPIHAGIRNPKLFEIEVDKIVNTDGLKFASKSQTLIKEISLPEISFEQRVEFAIRIAKLVCKDELWNAWADDWLAGKDRFNRVLALAVYTATRAAGRSYARAADAAAAVAAATYAANAADAYVAADAAAAAAAAAAVYADTKNEFNQKMIEIIESILDKQKS